MRDVNVHAFPGFESYPTQHCVTGSIKHVYDYHGYPISEELLLGLGEGLSFVYFHIKGTDPFFGGRGNVTRPGTEGFEHAIGRRTGVMVRAHKTASANKAEHALRDLLVARQPVLVYVDMGLLPYFDFPEEYHFGGHTVVVAGYDPETGDVLVADRDPELHPVAWDVLEKARGSTFKPFPPQHLWFTFDFSAARQPTSDDVSEAIRAVCGVMLEPPISNLGVKGIRKAITEARKWPKLLDDAALRRACFNVALFIDHRGGTGGGIFRYMYGRFLSEAAVIVGEPQLDAIGKDLEGVGDDWEAVAAAFAEAADGDNPEALLDAATEPMIHIADREEDVWERLRSVM